MRVLITGGAGFIGSHLARYCAAMGHQVGIIDKDFSKHKMSEFGEPPHSRWTVDLADYSASTNVEMIFGHWNADVCFHLAAYASEGRSNHIREYITRNNTLSTMRVINFCVKHKVKLVFTSSVAVFSGDGGFNDFTEPNPIDEYGLSKATSERSIQIAGETQGLKYTIVRPRNVYGPGQNLWDPSRNLFGIWINNVMHDRECLIYGDGEQKRQFTYIGDLIAPLYNAMLPQADGMAINLGAKTAWSINQAASIFSRWAPGARFRHTEARHEVKDAICSTAFAEKYLAMIGAGKETPLDLGLSYMMEWASRQAPREMDVPPPLEVNVNTHSSLM